MRKAFFHYLRPTKEELATLWRSAFFSFDASVLLNVYGYSEGTREELLGLLAKIAERTRLPHQFGLEFARNRARVILKQVGNYVNAEKALEDIHNKYLAPKHEHPFLKADSLRAFESIREEMRAGKREMEALISNDRYAERIADIFADRVGAAPSAETLQRWHQEAKVRFERSIPPGYADMKDKGEPDAFGDYVGWRQLIEIAKTEGKGLILICDDTKEDWWQIERDRTVGPRPELIEEFAKDAGQPFFMYNSLSFLRFAGEYLGQKIEANAIEEIRERMAKAIDIYARLSSHLALGAKPGAPSQSVKPDVREVSEPQKPLDPKPSSSEESAKPDSKPKDSEPSS